MSETSTQLNELFIGKQSPISIEELSELLKNAPIPYLTVRGNIGADFE